MTSPAISVLLPFRNEATHLPQALRSLEKQSFREFEVLCLDDGSTDDSPRIVTSFSQRDRRFVWLPLGANGLVHALNRGLSIARAPVFARMDADDLSHPRRFERQFDYLRAKPQVGVVGCLVRGFPSRHLNEGYKNYLRWLNSVITCSDVTREIFVESPLAHPSVMLRRKALERVGGYRQINGPEDYDLWLRFFLHEIPMAKVPETLYFWREHANRLSRTDPRYHRSRFWELKAEYLAIYLSRRADLRSRPVFIWGQRLAGRLVRQMLSAGIQPAGFININRQKQGRVRLNCPVYAPEILVETSDPFVIAAVSVPGAREDIRTACFTMGLEEGRDFVVAG